MNKQLLECALYIMFGSRRGAKQHIWMAGLGAWDPGIRWGAADTEIALRAVWPFSTATCMILFQGWHYLSICTYMYSLQIEWDTRLRWLYTALLKNRSPRNWVRAHKNHLLTTGYMLARSRTNLKYCERRRRDRRTFTSRPLDGVLYWICIGTYFSAQNRFFLSVWRIRRSKMCIARGWVMTPRVALSTRPYALLFDRATACIQLKPFTMPRKDLITFRCIEICW